MALQLVELLATALVKGRESALGLLLVRESAWLSAQEWVLAWTLERK